MRGDKAGSGLIDAAAPAFIARRHWAALMSTVLASQLGAERSRAPGVDAPLAAALRGAAGARLLRCRVAGPSRQVAAVAALSTLASSASAVDQHRRAVPRGQATANGACARRRHHRPASTVAGSTLSLEGFTARCGHRARIAPALLQARCLRSAFPLQRHERLPQSRGRVAGAAPLRRRAAQRRRGRARSAPRASDSSRACPSVAERSERSEFRDGPRDASSAGDVARRRHARAAVKRSAACPAHGFARA